MSKTADQIKEPAEPEVGRRAEHSDDGVELSLIRWMLDLTSTERLIVAEDFANDILELRGSVH